MSLNALQSISPEQALLEFTCNHELYEAFHILSEQINIQNIIKTSPLFYLYHITNIKYYINQTSKNIASNVLWTHLDDILQSFYNLIPQYQPQHIQSLNNESPIEPIDTSYSSIFYKLHQEIKIQSILSCNEAQHIKTNLINTNFKLNPSIFNFRHINIKKDIDENNEIEFEIIDIIEILGSINKKNQKNPQKIDQFIESHSFNVFKIELMEYINSIKASYCHSMNDLIYTVAATLRSNQRENQLLQSKQSPEPKTAPKTMQTSLNPMNNNRNTNIKQKAIQDYFSNPNTETFAYKKGMDVKIRQNNNTNDETPYIWKTAKVIQITKHRITVTLLDGNHHRVIRDFSKIKPIMDIDECSDSSDDEDDDIQMMDNTNATQKRPKRNTNSSVQSANYERGRRFWEEQEDVALRKGLIKYKDIIDKKTRGVPGIWSKIKADDDAKDESERKLKHRTTKMLYDRYRVFAKKGTLPKECVKS